MKETIHISTILWTVTWLFKAKWLQSRKYGKMLKSIILSIWKVGDTAERTIFSKNAYIWERLWFHVSYLDLGLHSRGAYLRYDMVYALNIEIQGLHNSMEKISNLSHFLYSHVLKWHLNQSGTKNYVIQSPKMSKSDYFWGF